MSDPNNRWSAPAAPPPPMFFGKKERDLVKQVNDELAERVVGQTVAYYPISIEESNFNDTYGESIDKVSLPPVRVYAYVVVENEQTNERYGYDYQTKLTVNFHRKRLVADQDLYVRVGDFVQYGEYFYEIVKTYNDTRYYFGQVEHKFQISAECVRAREGVFRVEPALTRPGVAVTTETTGQSPAPRATPYPPLDATYITVTSNTKLPSERVLTAGSGITLTDAGAGGALTIAAAGQNAVGPTGSIQFQLGAGSFSGSSNLTYLPATTRLGIGISAPTHNLTVVGNMSASSDVLIGGDLTVKGTLIGASPLKISGSINVVNALGTTVATLGSSSLGPEVLSSSLGVVTNLTASGLVSASFFYGDGSNLAGVVGSPGGSATQIQYNDGSAFQGSTNLTFNGTTLTGSYTGSLAQVTTLSASLMSLLPTSGTLAGGGSYLGLDANNNVILSAGDGATTSPAGSTTEVQFNNAGAFGASSNLTFNSTSNLLALTGTMAVSSSGDAALFRVDGATSGSILFVTGSGRVGIGTDDPQVALHISGSDTAAVSARFEYSPTGENIDISPEGTGPAIYFGQAPLGSPKGSYMKFGSFSSTNNIHTKERDFHIYGTNTGIADGFSFDESEGFFGFGTQTPVSILQVSSSGDAALFRVDGATAGNVLFVTGSGRVGIGTETPTARLHVSGNASTAEVRVTSDTKAIQLVPGNGPVVAFGTAADPDFYMKIGAYAGFNQIGVFSAEDFQISSSTGGIGYYFDQSESKVGILTTSPTHTLTVAGASHLSGGLVHKRTQVAAHYTASATDYILGVTAAPLSIEFDATAFADGQVVVIKDESGTASSTNTITLNPAGAQTVDGASTVGIESPHGSVLLYSDGSNWFIY